MKILIFRERKEVVLLKAEAYVDGSFYPPTGKYGSGILLLLEDGQKYRIHYGGVIMDSQKQKNGSLIGELKAAEIAVAHALELRCSRITIFYDCLPVSKFAVSPPKNNSPEEAKLYNQKMKEYMKHIPISFEHVKAHSGDSNNFTADQEARIGAGISAAGLEKQTLADKEINKKTDEVLKKYSDIENVKKAAPVRIYVYACRKNNSVCYSIIKRTDGMEIRAGMESSQDETETACRKIIEECEHAMQNGAENIVVFSKVENILKYANRPINPSSRTVDEKYKRLSLFCVEARKRIALSVRSPESDEEIEDFAEAEGSVKWHFKNVNTDGFKQVFVGQLNAMFNELYVLDGSLSTDSSEPVKIYTYGSIENGELLYSIVKCSMLGAKVICLEGLKEQSALREPAAVICESVMNACRKEIKNGADNITVYSKFADVIRAGNGAILNRDDRYVRFAEFCDQMKEICSLKIENPETEDDQRRIGLVKRVQTIYRSLRDKIILNVSSDDNVSQQKSNEKEKKVNKEEICEMKKNPSEEENSIMGDVMKEPETNETARPEQTEDFVMEYLTLSAEMSRIQMQMKKVYTAMSDDDRTRLESIAEYISSNAF